MLFLFYKFQSFEMANEIIQLAKRAIPAGYIGLQGLAIMIVNILKISSWSHYVLALISTCTYLWTAFSNPGYVIYEDIQEPPHPPSRSEPVISMSPSEMLQAIKDELQMNLGVQRKIKENQTEMKQPEKQPGSFAQIGSDEKVSQELKKKPVSIINDQKIKKFQSQKNAKDHKKETIQKKDENKIGLNEIKESTVIPIQLREVVRWCNSCKNQQKLRVRHCYQCNKCVLTFDHHCPLMNTCIGQKNKFPLILFSFFQFLQLFQLVFSLENAISHAQSKQITLLWIIVLIINMMIFVMFIFQLYLISRNITTWQYVCWNKIEYLNIFNKNKLKSLFDRGLMSNIKIFVKSSFLKQPTNWMKLISSEAHKHLIDCENPTDRRIIAK